MTTPTTEEPTRSWLGRAIAFRMQPRGTQFGRRQTTPQVGRLASASERFAAAVARPNAIRRALFGSQERPVHQFSNAPVAPTERRWWHSVLSVLALPRNPMHSTDTRVEWRPPDEPETPPTQQPIELDKLPPRGLPKVIRQVPSEDTYTPGSIVESLRPSVVAVRRIDDVTAAGQMLTKEERAVHAASLANPQVYVPPMTPGRPRLGGHRDRTPQIGTHREQGPPPPPPPPQSQWTSTPPNVSQRPREGRPIAGAHRTGSTATEDDFGQGPQATPGTSATATALAATALAPPPAKPSWLPTLYRRAAKVIALPRSPLGPPPQRDGSSRQVHGAPEIIVTPTKAAKYAKKEARLRRATGEAEPVKPSHKIGRAITGVFAIPRYGLGESAGDRKRRLQEWRPTEEEAQSTPSPQPSTPSAPQTSDVSPKPEKKPPEPEQVELPEKEEETSPLERLRSISVLPMSHSDGLPTTTSQGLPLASEQGDDIQPAIRPQIRGARLMSPAQEEDADNEFDRASSEPNAISYEAPKSKFNTTLGKPGKAMFFWWPILPEPKPGEKRKPDNEKRMSMTIYGVPMIHLVKAVEKVVGVPPTTGGLRSSFSEPETISPSTSPEKQDVAPKTSGTAPTPDEGGGPEPVPVGGPAADDLAVAAGRRASLAGSQRPVSLALVTRPPVAIPVGAVPAPASVSDGGGAGPGGSAVAPVPERAKFDQQIAGLQTLVGMEEVVAAARLGRREKGTVMSEPENASLSPQVWRRATPSALPERRVDPRKVLNDRRWFEELVDRIVDRIERRVIDELERRGRRHGRGAY